MGIIDNIIQDKQDIKNQLGTTPTVFPTVKQFNNKFEVKRHSTVIYDTAIAGAMIWGHPSFGIWGTSNWGDGSGGSFILGSTGFGILGTNKLGANGSETVLYAIIPQNNRFREYFVNTTYIDTITSTGVIDTNFEKYTLGNGQILQSGIIAKPRGAITSARFLQYGDISDTGAGLVLPFTLGVDTFGGDNARVQLSNDGGTTWEDVQSLDATHTFSSSTTDDELKYRITANDTIVIDVPLIIKVN